MTISKVVFALATTRRDHRLLWKGLVTRNKINLLLTIIYKNFYDDNLYTDVVTHMFLRDVLKMPIFAGSV